MDLKGELAAALLRPEQVARDSEALPSSPSLWTLIAEDWAAHGGDWTKPGFRALAVYRFGVWRMGVKRAPLRKALSLLYRVMERRIRRAYGIELPYAAVVGRGVVIEHQNGIVIHGGAIIGDRCVIRQGVTIGSRGIDDPFGAPTLGKNVQIGANAVLIGRITVGDGARIGAGAIVVKDVPTGATAVGNPAVVRLASSSGSARRV